MFLADENVAEAKPTNVVDAFLASKKFPAYAHPSFQSISKNPPAQVRTVSLQSSSGDVDSISPTSLSLPQPPEISHQVEELSLDELYQDADQAKKSFQAALQQYESQAPPGGKTHVDLATLHTWDEVIDVAKEDLKKYKASSGVHGWLRRMVRHLGSNKQIALAWADFLPSQNEYFSVLCGGLKVIIRAAARLTQIEDQLLLAIEHFPEHLNLTHQTLPIFRSAELHRCSAALYAALLSSLMVMIEYLHKRSIGVFHGARSMPLSLSARFFGSLFKLDGFSNNIERSLENIERTTRQFRDCAQRCDYAANADTRSTVKTQLRETRQARQEALQQFALMRLDGQSQRDQEIKEMRRVGDQILENMHLDMNNVDATLKQLMSLFLASHPRVDPKTHNLRAEPLGLTRSRSDSERYKRRSRGIRRQLMHTLRYEETVITNDINSHLSLPTDARWRAPDRAYAIMRHPKMLEWMARTGSSALFVNGNHYQSFQQPPTSFVAARLVTTVHAFVPRQEETAGSIKRVIALSFFCARHKHLKDPDAGPGGMLRSLLAQLLAAYLDFDLINIGRLRDVDNQDIDDLYTMFEDLIVQLPPNYLVFCILDNVTTYEERSGWKKDAERVVQHLLRLAADADLSCCAFKVLFTSPIKSNSLYHALPEDRVIWMPDKIPAAGNVTEQAWKVILSVPTSTKQDPVKLVHVSSNIELLSHEDEADEEEEETEG